MTNTIDARLLTPDTLILDPLGDDQILQVDRILIERTYPHSQTMGGPPDESDPVDVVRLVVSKGRGEDDRRFTRVLDVGQEVTVVPPKPVVQVTWDYDAGRWDVSVDGQTFGTDDNDPLLDVELKVDMMVRILPGAQSGSPSVWPTPREGAVVRLDEDYPDSVGDYYVIGTEDTPVLKGQTAPADPKGGWVTRKGFRPIV